MKVNFKKPRYVIPLIALPFLFVLYYVFNDFFIVKEDLPQQTDSLQEKISEVSDEIKTRELSDKLAAYRDQYRKGDGYTAISQLQQEQESEFKFNELYNELEKHKLDSIEKSFSKKQMEYHIEPNTTRKEDIALQNALNSIPYNENTNRNNTIQSVDPMELFRKQMMLADSFAKANDPNLKDQEEKELHLDQSINQKKHIRGLKVEKYSRLNKVFNTIKIQEEESLIKAIIDENRTAHADSRLRIRLLEDLKVGDYKINKGTFLYAKVSGFTAQRVQLSISSVLFKNKILPINIDIYDQDGQAGLFIPESKFREFSRELSSNTTQGITINQQAENNAQLLMSTIQRMFQSTSSAINKHIRKNKAKIKYNTHIFLMDTTN